HLGPAVAEPEWPPANREFAYASASGLGLRASTHLAYRVPAAGGGTGYMTNIGLSIAHRALLAGEDLSAAKSNGEGDPTGASARHHRPRPALDGAAARPSPAACPTRPAGSGQRLRHGS